MERSKQRFLKNMVGFSMVTWISFALGFIATPISTRLFAPAELARVSMFGTYTSLFCSVCYLGLDQAFVRFFRETPGRMTPRALLTFCLSVALGFGVVSSAVLLGFWRSLSGAIVGQPDFSIFLCLCSTAARWSFSVSCRCATGWSRTRCSTPSRAWCMRC